MVPAPGPPSISSRIEPGVGLGIWSFGTPFRGSASGTAPGNLSTSGRTVTDNLIIYTNIISTAESLITLKKLLITSISDILIYYANTNTTYN